MVLRRNEDKEMEYIHVLVVQCKLRGREGRVGILHNVN